MTRNMAETIAYCCPAIFDGERNHNDAALLVSNGVVQGIVPLAEVKTGTTRVELGAGTLAPGLIDLQVNGGGGLMLGDMTCVEDLAHMCRAHVALGTTSLLPTLITDRPEVTHRVVNLAREAIAEKIPGFQGLHLEGPHLSKSRKGAHDAGLIRTMEARDLELYTATARDFPNLLLTVAPETVTGDQIGELTEAGAVVSLGHSDASYDLARAAADAGAVSMTHLFNAMSPLAHRDAGMVGAALNIGTFHAGLIADGVHVDAAAIEIALRAKKGPGHIFLVTDAMAVAGSALTEFTLGGRRILRSEGRLTLEDGTLAGADIDLPASIRFLCDHVGLTYEEALRMATVYPAQVLGKAGKIGCLLPSCPADFVHFDECRRLSDVWIAGRSAR